MPLGNAKAPLNPYIVRRTIEQAAVLDESGRLREPVGIPEGADFAFGLVTRTGAAVKAFEGGGIQEKSAHGLITLVAQTRFRKTAGAPFGSLPPTGRPAAA